MVAIAFRTLQLLTTQNYKAFKKVSTLHVQGYGKLLYIQGVRLTQEIVLEAETAKFRFRPLGKSLIDSEFRRRRSISRGLTIMRVQKFTSREMIAE